MLRKSPRNKRPPQYFHFVPETFRKSKGQQTSKKLHLCFELGYTREQAPWTFLHIFTSDGTALQRIQTVRDPTFPLTRARRWLAIHALSIQPNVIIQPMPSSGGHCPMLIPAHFFREVCVGESARLHILQSSHEARFANAHLSAALGAVLC